MDGNALTIANTSVITLTIDASNYGSINLSKLINGDSATAAGKLTIDNVESGKINLLAPATGSGDFIETIVLGANASKVTIGTLGKSGGVGAQDKVDATAVGLTKGKDSDVSDGIDANKVCINTTGANSVDTIRALITTSGAAAVDSFVLSRKGGSGDVYELYKVTEAITKDAKDGAIELIATLTSEASGTADVTGGVISF